MNKRNQIKYLNQCHLIGYLSTLLEVEGNIRISDDKYDYIVNDITHRKRFKLAIKNLNRGLSIYKGIEPKRTPYMNIGTQKQIKEFHSPQV